MLTATLFGRHCNYPHFIGEETEGFRGEIACLKVSEMVSGRARFEHRQHI